MPFDVSDERNLLASMIAERDAQISSLTHQLHSTTDALRDVRREVSSRTSARRRQREDHAAAIRRLKDEHAEWLESSYVLRLQAQLCGAMHGLGVMESQLALVKENCSSLIRFMREDLSRMVDDRTRREVELMNGLARVDNEKRLMAAEMERKIREREELLDQVREEYEELGLEYDEDEVKRALEVRYLLEQMEKVREDRVRLEGELLAALLEREEQIQRLKDENARLDERFEELTADEGGRRRGGGGDATLRSDDGGTMMAASAEEEQEGEENVDGGDVDEGDAASRGSDGYGQVAGDADDQMDERGGGEKDEVATWQEDVVVSEVASRSENSTLVGQGEMPASDADAAEDSTPGNDTANVDDDDEPSSERRGGHGDGQVAGDADDQVEEGGGIEEEDVALKQEDVIASEVASRSENSVLAGEADAPASNAAAAAAEFTPCADA
ncbi:hypothetical protein ACHAW5_010475 [Stephanodiscus triporus]|uniref:Uncharacterized protein n=1 Tax=Stephanodiscus triporus TaxID=2934178 RepID=A0ABD3NEP4_9STRA